jgi:hypothetical protein
VQRLLCLHELRQRRRARPSSRQSQCALAKPLEAEEKEEGADRDAQRVEWDRGEEDGADDDG